MPESSRDSQIQPLIEASESFPALEAAILAAEREVLMAYWTFDPQMPLRGPDHPAGLTCWADLLLHKARQGVVLRILLGDFDPVFGHAFHAANGAAYLDLMALRQRLPEARRRCLQVVTSRHEARAGRLIEGLVQPLRWRQLGRVLGEGRQRLAQEGQAALAAWLRAAPGLWPSCRLTPRGPRRRWGALVGAVYPASHHEKSCVVDRRVAFVGGLDIDAKRYDTPQHDARDAWHDLAVRIDGPLAADLARRLAQRWNAERQSFHRAVARQGRPAGAPPPGVAPWPDAPTEAVAVGDAARAGADSGAGGETALVGTGSGAARWAFQAVPQTCDGSIRAALYRLIDGARALLYLETQFLRDRAVAARIARRAAAAPDLRVILLLPLLPELLTEARDANRATRHGHWLQWRCVRALQAALGPRFGVYTLLRNAPAKAEAPAHTTALGSDLVYCHAKLALADDRRALVGSANLNGRSLTIDTEACLDWQDPVGVAAFRRRLWRQHFGGAAAGGPAPDGLDSADLAQAAARWDALAQANTRRPPGRRQGFVVPFPDSHLRFQARRSRIVPDASV